MEVRRRDNGGTGWMARLCKPESLNCPKTGRAAAVFAPSGAVPAFEESLAALMEGDNPIRKT